MREVFLAIILLLRKDRNRAGGGVVLNIRNNIPFSYREDLVLSSLEMVFAEINRSHSKSFQVQVDKICNGGKATKASASTANIER